MTLVEATRLASFGLVVLIWLVQVIIYPAFAESAPERFVLWHAGYTRALTWIVAPLMLGQVALLVWLLIVRPSSWGFLLAVYRDCFLLNVLMLVRPIGAVKSWQTGH